MGGGAGRGCRRACRRRTHGAAPGFTRRRARAHLAGNLRRRPAGGHLALGPAPDPAPVTFPPAAAFAPAEPALDAPLDARALEAQYAATADRVRAFAAGLTEAQGRWRPRPGAWSVAEILAHVAEVDRSYFATFDAAIARARAAGARPAGARRLGWFGRTFTRAMGPVTGRGLGRKLPAPPYYAPPSDLSLGEALAAFLAANRGVADRARAAAAVDPSRVLVRSPAWPLLRFSLLTALAALAAHERRHLAQARRLAARPEFPAP